ncbi:nuclear transport factor 2 family protein [Methylobacterium iners]|uniref:nuclear transport factor 2 family protein n=1 Tax=Methylobacterium iners TaxID=418707 RepID=UPI0024B5CFA8|nr:nuclear transport factor 2 family protein [Methylobacterium iners]
MEGPSVYDDLLDPACLMAFPGMGVMRATDILASLREAPRWTSVVMSNRALARPRRDVLVLGYTAEGHRDGSEPYRCHCTSTYVEDGGHWKLVQHQQTMAA